MITPLAIDLIQSQARQFNGMADTIEQTFKLNGKADQSTPSLPALGAVSADQIKSALSEKSQRVADLAKKFNVETFEIDRILKGNPDTFEKGPQGWIKVKK